MGEYLYIEDNEIKLSNKLPEIFDFIKNTNLTQNKLINFFENNTYVLNIDNSYLSNNISLLMLFLEKTNISKLIITSIINLDIIHENFILIKWMNYFSDNDNIISYINNLIIKNNNNLQVDNVINTASKLNVSLDLFKKLSKIKNNEMLTSVEVNEEISSKIIESLGTKIDISDVLLTNNNDISYMNYIIYSKLIDIFSPGSVKFEKNSILKSLKKVSKTEDNTVTKLQNIINLESYIPINGQKFEIVGTEFRAIGNDANLVSQLNIDDNIVVITSTNTKSYFKVVNIISNNLAYVENTDDITIAFSACALAIKYSKYIPKLFILEEKISNLDGKDKSYNDLATFIIQNFESNKMIKNPAEKYYNLSVEIMALLNEIYVQDKEYKSLKKKKVENIKKYQEIDKNIEELNKKFPVETKKKILRPWQEKMIDNIKKGNSVLINGPTGGGKTYISMIAFDYFFKELPDGIIVYVAPNFHLALQIYCNFKATFPNKNCSFINNVMDAIAPNSKIFFGTPLELSVYLSTEGIDFDIGIFDEIHTVSVSFATDNLSEKKPEAISNLLGRCKKQIIALSATINEKDNDILRKYLKYRTNIKNIVRITYKTRPVKLERFIYNKDSSLSVINPNLFKDEEVGEIIEENLIDNNENLDNLFSNLNLQEEFHIEDEKFIEEEIIDKSIMITPENTFNLLKDLEEKNMLSAIFFDYTEEECYNNFVKYVEWVEHEDITHLSSWYKLYDELYVVVNKFNNDQTRIRAENLVNESLTSKNDVKIKEAEARSAPMIILRREVLQKIVNEIEKEIIKNVRDDKDVKYVKKLNDSEIISLSNIIGRRENNVSYNVHACLKEYIEFTKIKNESTGLATIPFPFEGTPEYFRIGKKISAIKEFKSMITSNPTNEDTSILNTTKILCDAENINISHIKKIIQLIIKGLEFGVTIIIPTLPFVIQNQILKVMTEVNNRNISRNGKNVDDIKCIFASQSMALGINYSFRTTIIRCNRYMFCNVSSFRQMEGRCGRQGLDNKAYVISINVSNASETNLSNLPRIELPKFGPTKGCLLPNYLSKAMDIEENRLKYDISFDNDDEENISKETIRRFRIRGQKKLNKLERLNLDKNSDIAEDNIMLENAIKCCIEPLARDIGLDNVIIDGIIERIISITKTKTLVEQYKQDPYLWIQRINEIKASIQELYVRFHNNECKDFLIFLKNIYRILHKFQYAQF